LFLFASCPGHSRSYRQVYKTTLFRASSSYASAADARGVSTAALREGPSVGSERTDIQFDRPSPAQINLMPVLHGSAGKPLLQRLEHDSSRRSLQVHAI